MSRTKYKELDNKVIRFVLTNDERYRLYKNINEARGKILLKDISQQMTPFRPDPDIVEKFTEIMRRETGENFILADMCFARYELVKAPNGDTYNPRLELHKDVNFEGPRVVLDYQVASNIDWDLIIQKDEEDNLNSYTLKDNDLLIFSGTDQMHGRVKRDFAEGEYLELLFMHFSQTGQGVNPKQIINVQNR